ncbi:MAG: alpha-amylase family glycosyl hydrolase [Schleiferiaceae bacterium]|nr:alpha-amylase family glycosyl hydrolase [Schleiferiaceae bacterium]MDR9441789.1 alpha-amylase family glycosyl hydrolase [Schleiferiaceae bacterium]
MNKSLITAAFGLTAFVHSAQVVTVDPPFPNQNDTVTVIFDASEGNGALAGVSPVYGHTGVITQSGGPGSWQYVQGNWGTPDPSVLMNDLGNDKHTITYHLPTFYGFPGSTSVTDLSFVFRDASGNTVGRASDGSDIFYPVYPVNSGFQAAFFAPKQTPAVNASDSVRFYAATSQDATITLFDNGVQIGQVSSARAIRKTIQAGAAGPHTVVMEANNGSTTIRDTVRYVTNPPVQTAPAPAGAEYGIHINSPSQVTLKLHAPFKNNIYVIGTFNDFQPDTSFYMKRTPGGNDWWITINGLNGANDIVFQYLIDGEMRVADPYSKLVLDPFNDQYVDSLTFPNLPDYPEDKTTGIATWLRMQPPNYQWQNPNFQAPAKDELVVYELLLRDFVAKHNYQTLLDSLDYLERLGINAIELMPVNEFEGNESWGYNPSFHLALDKYYGTPEKFKEFVDACHGRGIAVILDAVFNHAYSQSPLVQMWFDPAAGSFGQPTAQNPYFNQTPRHDFNVGYDFNHESLQTKIYTKTALKYWLQEFKIDGYRFDLSKGFTQNNTLGNVAAWGQYDQSRVNILKDYKNAMETVNPEVYPILEHFADNSEEQALANDGFMIWGNMNHSYSEAAMGYLGDSDFKGVLHSNRGYNFKHLVGYQESHDEQRLMYKNLQFGNGSGNYNTKQLGTALDRMELNALFFYTLPGPKMLWQFGEVGYDVDINNPCRICNKPILWNYYQDADRRDLYNVTADLLALRDRYGVFNTNTYRYDFSGGTKRVNLDGQVNATIIGNFDVTAQDAYPNFQHTGWWYSFFEGDSINVSNVNDPINLQPGEYRLYTDQPVSDGNNIGRQEASYAPRLRLFPNPTDGPVAVDSEKPLQRVELYSLAGQRIRELDVQASAGERYHLDLSSMAKGTYLLYLTTDQGRYPHKIVIQ